MKKSRIVALGAVVAAGAMVLSSCSGPAGEEPNVIAGTEIRVAYSQNITSTNDSTADGNFSPNGISKYLTSSGFQYYNNDPALVKNTAFGSFEKISDDPLQVRYTVNEGVVWQDGVQIDAADLLLAWASISPTYDDAGWDEANGQDLFVALPEIGEDGRTITIEYDEPYNDWELGFGNSSVPAHTTVQLAYPDLDAAAAKEQFIDAVVNKDFAWLKPVAEKWNTAYNLESMPALDEDGLSPLLPSSGAYLIEDFVPGEAGYVTYKFNPLYNWGPQPFYERIVVSVQGDSTAALQQLLNGEIAAYDGQPSEDLLAQLDAAKSRGVDYVGAPQATYEHIDLTFNREGGPFNPATYGGDEEVAKAVRLAFMHIVPRDQILNDLIIPLQANAEIRNSQLLVPGAPGYAESVAASGAEKFNSADHAAAKALLDEAGVSYPIDVIFKHAANNPRRAGIGELTRASAEESGLFNVILDADPAWSSNLGNGTYDAITFAWQSTSLSVGASDQTFANPQDNPDLNNPSHWAGSNFNRYNNNEVNALNRQLRTEFDPAEQQRLMGAMDAHFFADGYGLTLFQFPGLVFWDATKVSGVTANQLSPGYFWNFWDWKPVEESAS